jgi:hypothetical protein
LRILQQGLHRSRRGRIALKEAHTNGFVSTAVV